MGDAIDTIFGGGQAQAFEQLRQSLGQAQTPVRQAVTGAQRGLLPFQKAGVSALPQLQALAGQDPTSVIQGIESKFQTSPGAQEQIAQGIRAANLAASAGGTVGSGAEQKRLAQFAGGVTSEDMQNFLRNVLGVRGAQTGILQQLAGGGLGAAGEAGKFGMRGGEDIANLLAQMGVAGAKGTEARASGLENLAGFGLGFL